MNELPSILKLTHWKIKFKNLGYSRKKMSLFTNGKKYICTEIGCVWFILFPSYSLLYFSEIDCFREVMDCWAFFLRCRATFRRSPSGVFRSHTTRPLVCIVWLRSFWAPCQVQSPRWKFRHPSNPRSNHFQYVMRKQLLHLLRQRFKESLY